MMKFKTTLVMGLFLLLPLSAFSAPEDGNFLAKSIGDKKIVAEATLTLDVETHELLLAGQPLFPQFELKNQTTGNFLYSSEGEQGISFPAGTFETVFGTPATGKIKATYDPVTRKLRCRFIIKTEDFVTTSTDVPQFKVTYSLHFNNGSLHHASATVGVAVDSLLGVSNDGSFLVKTFGNERVTANATLTLDTATAQILQNGQPISPQFLVNDLATGNSLYSSAAGQDISFPAGSNEVIFGTLATGKIKATFNPSTGKLTVRLILKTEDLTPSATGWPHIGVNYQLPMANGDVHTAGGTVEVGFNNGEG